MALVIENIFIFWKSKGLPDERIDSIATSNNTNDPLLDYLDHKQK